jgi:hypothetical protein
MQVPKELQELLGSFTPKELLTLLLSGAAFVFSTIASVFGYLRKRNEEKRHFSNQLHSLVTRLLELAGEYNKDYAKANQDVSMAMFTNGQSGNPNALNDFNATSQLRGQHMVALARRADGLIATTKAEGTDIEYVAIAKGLAFAQDPQAKTMFERAVASAPSPIYKISNYRDYAGFLFNIGAVADGRGIYAAALRLTDELQKQMRHGRATKPGRGGSLSEDQLHFQRGATHGLWSNSEFAAKCLNESREQLKLAETEFHKIENDFLRNSALSQMLGMSQILRVPTPAPVAASSIAALDKQDQPLAQARPTS